MLNNRFVPSDQPLVPAGLLVATDEELDAVEGGKPSEGAALAGTVVAIVGGILIGGPYGLAFAIGGILATL